MVPSKGSNVAGIQTSYRSAAGARDGRARPEPGPDRAVCSKGEKE